MNYFQIHKQKFIYFFLVLIVAFKLVAVQEYIHIKEHQEKQVHQENCQVCHTIFQIGKFQSFDEPQVFQFVFYPLTKETQLRFNSYEFLYFQKINFSELYNRPPPCI